MALRQLVISKRISSLKSQLDALRKKDEEFKTRKEALKTREVELETAINEVTDETPDEDKQVVDESVEKFEADQKAIDEEVKANDEAKQGLEAEIEKLQKELNELDTRSNTPPVANPVRTEQRGETRGMKTRVRFFDSIEQRDGFFAREDVKQFITEIRSIKTRGVTNGSLTIPDIMLEVLRDNMELYSKLIKYVTVKKIGGTARQNIMGAVPEGVWMEATGALNELDMALNQIEVDGFMVGGIIFVHNTLLEDSDIDLGSEIMSQLGQSIGKGVDRGILFGTGTKQPVGIATRLAQTAAPSNWNDYAPTWTDLHTANIKKLNIDGTTGSAFYASLIAALGVAKPNYSDGRCFWVVNRATHIKLMTKALAFDAAAALVAGVHNQMPIIGGDIVELEMVGDNTIIGGYGSVYLLAERAGAKVDSSEHAKFKEMMTGFRGYARYDGMPVFGEAFVVVNFANADAATSSTFPTDYANTELGALVVASVAGTATGDTKVTVTGAEATGTTLGYKVGGKVAIVQSGDSNKGFVEFDSGDDITVATGKIITVVEFDGNGKAIKIGFVAATAKA